MTVDVNGDIVFDVITISCLVAFTFEIIITIIVKDDYLWSFFFFLDLISTISLILDISIVTNVLFYGGGASSVTNTASLARAGRAGRVGSK
jgi:hypothetical protein